MHNKNLLKKKKKNLPLVHPEAPTSLWDKYASPANWVPPGAGSRPRSPAPSSSKLQQRPEEKGHVQKEGLTLHSLLGLPENV